MFINIKKINYELYLLLITFIGSIIIILVNNTNLNMLIVLNTFFFIPFFIYFSKGSEFIYNKKFPYFETIILLIYIYYFSIFFFDYQHILFIFLEDNSVRLNKAFIDRPIINKNLIIDKVLLIYTFSITTLIASYYFFRNLLNKVKSKNTIFFKDQNHIEKIGYILFFLFFVLDYFSYSKNVAIVSEIKTVIIYTSVLFHFLQSNNGFKSSLKYFLISFLFCYYIPKTFIAPIINISILILLIDWFLRKKINFLILGFFFVTFFIIMQTKPIHRYNLETHKLNTANITIKENLIIFTKYSMKKLSLKKLSFAKESKEKESHMQQLSIERKVINSESFFEIRTIGYLKRLAMPSITLVHTLQFNNVAESYIGKTILFPFYSLVPSIIWKNKPSFNFGNKFGHDFYFLHDIDFKTSINIPLITELYLNHYYKGLLIGMLLFGFMISLVEFLISKFFNKDNILQLIFIACTFSFTYLETSAIFIINGLTTKLIFMLTFVFIINKILVLISKIINK